MKFMEEKYFEQAAELLVVSSVAGVSWILDDLLDQTHPWGENIHPL